MAKYQHFEDWPVWQEAARLYNAVLDALDDGELALTEANEENEGKEWSKGRRLRREED